MKLRYFLSISLVLLIAVSAAFFADARSLWKGVCPIQSDTNVVFYGETGFGGVGDLSKSWITHFLDWWKSYDSNIKYVILDSSDVKTDCNLTDYPNVKVYFQPGGDAYYQQKALGSIGKTNINNYINSGRAYVGMCAGFYYAAGDYYWQGKYYNWPDLLGRYPTVEGSITDIADYNVPPGYALASVSNGENMIYYGGPTRGWRQTPVDYPGNALLTYTGIPNNLPAAIKNNSMLLTSVHPEAYENDGVTGLTAEQRIRNYIWFANAINDVAGTNFSAPSLPSPPVCGNLVCESGENWQNCPSDCPVLQPAEIFFDGFESGISGWNLSKASGANYWTAATTNPYSESYHAQSRPMSTAEPASVMEKAISTSGYSNIKVSYYRKLIGLDAADEFKAKWFDGANWQILEQTGSNSANDASYNYKEYGLPSAASNNPNFKLRFECTAGATSEYCRVDNVKITAN